MTKDTLQLLGRILLVVMALTASTGVTSIAAELPHGLVQPKERVPFPNIPFLDEHGTTKTIAFFRGKVVVLNFWATWCPPCVKEIPSLQRLEQRLPREAYAVLAISQDKGGVAVVKTFLQRIGATDFPLYVDPKGQLYRDLGIRGLPTTIVVGNDGFVEARMEGPAEWDKDEFISYLLAFR